MQWGWRNKTFYKVGVATQQQKYSYITIIYYVELLVGKHALGAIAGDL